MPYNIFESMGFIGAMILIAGLISVFFFIDRLYYLNKISLDVPNFVDGIFNLLKTKKINEALTLCEEIESPITSIIRICILHKDNTIYNMEIKISSIASLEINCLLKRLDLLKFLCLISSSLGLIGSLISILSNFDRILQNNLRLDPQTLLSFYSYAVNTTIFGVSISLIIYTFYLILHYRINTIITEMEWTAHKMCVYFVENR